MTLKVSSTQSTVISKMEPTYTYFYTEIADIQFKWGHLAVLNKSAIMKRINLTPCCMSDLCTIHDGRSSSW